MDSGDKLYLECYSGISGDMTVAALLDLGADENVMREALESLPVQGFQIEIKRVTKSGIDACDFNVVLDAEHENHDHDMEYLHGHDHGHYHGGEESHGHSHRHDGEEAHGHSHHHDEEETCGHGHHHGGEESHGHGHHHGQEEACGHSHHHHDGEEAHQGVREEGYGHDHVHSHDHIHSHEDGHDHGHSHVHVHSHGHPHHHEHRGMAEIREIIGQGKMTEGARTLALKIFQILAEAESKAHNVPVDQVHFHEVGAVDSIVDIVAAAVCLDNLGIREVVVPMLCEGTGTIRCQHGILPVPVPAVANIMKLHRLPVRIVDAEGEFVTPTGAAIVAAVKTSETLPRDFSVEKVGIGAGKRNYERPGILRAMVIRDKSEERDIIFKLETNIDDCTGEALGYVMGQLFEAGARDVHYMPVFMKKNRPAWQLNVICGQKDIQKLEHIIFRETTTIGIRRVEMERTVLAREQKTVRTPLGEAQVKACQARGVKRFYPEYDSIAKLAGNNQVPFSYVYQMVQKQCIDEL